MLDDVIRHIRGETSIGHYLVGKDGLVKLMAFDIDLIKTTPSRPVGFWPADPANEADHQLREFIPRDAWADRAHPSRNWTKYQMMMIATRIASVITDPRPGGWGLRCLVSYSGSKGVHVYAFFEDPLPAEDARVAGRIVLEGMGWIPKRASVGGSADSYNPSVGDKSNFFVSEDRDPVTGYPNFEIEVYPKQDKVREGGFGNLMRLPLGRNFKSERDTAFLIDCTQRMGVMKPVQDVLFALNTCNPFVRPGDPA